MGESSRKIASVLLLPGSWSGCAYPAPWVEQLAEHMYCGGEALKFFIRMSLLGSHKAGRVGHSKTMSVNDILTRFLYSLSFLVAI